MKTHHYRATIEWTGNLGEGTSGYRNYSRDHIIRINGKPSVEASSDPAFRGDPQRYNPEELLLASLSSCHMLWYLHCCAEAGIVVTAYEDHAEGQMEENADGSGQFTVVKLKPVVTIAAGSDPVLARQLHETAHHKCFIARSVNFEVACAGEIICAD